MYGGRMSLAQILPGEYLVKKGKAQTHYPSSFEVGVQWIPQLSKYFPELEDTFVKLVM